MKRKAIAAVLSFILVACFTGCTEKPPGINTESSVTTSTDSAQSNTYASEPDSSQTTIKKIDVLFDNSLTRFDLQDKIELDWKKSGGSYSNDLAITKNSNEIGSVSAINWSHQDNETTESVCRVVVAGQYGGWIENKHSMVNDTTMAGEAYHFDQNNADVQTRHTIVTYNKEMKIVVKFTFLNKSVTEENILFFAKSIKVKQAN